MLHGTNVICRRTGGNDGKSAQRWLYNVCFGGWKGYCVRHRQRVIICAEVSGGLAELADDRHVGGSGLLGLMRNSVNEGMYR